ncbi:MAG: hypothetical protein LBN25_01600 [Christensenellaceae bacterium]|jgi:hypothetical protein|nr:hypothetical protein [Christensenellaceae bacterium]
MQNGESKQLNIKASRLIVVLVSLLSLTLVFFLSWEFLIVNDIQIESDGPLQTVTAAQIIGKTDIKPQAYSVTISEEALKEKIENAFPNHAITVKEVKRRLQTITIRVEENLPVMFFLDENETAYVTDITLTRHEEMPHETAAENGYIRVYGTTYNELLGTQNAQTLTNVLKGIVDGGTPVYALTAYIQLITYENGEFNITLKNEQTAIIPLLK